MCPAIAYEMLVSHSPPVFSHSPPMGFLSQYAPFCLNPDQFPRSCRPMTPPILSCKASLKMPTLPKRPCLVIRPKEFSECEETPTSPTRLKKKVVFADDKGMSLTHVRIMSEPSNMPPLWSCKFLAEVTQGLTAEPEAHDEPWTITFPQPASDYVDFRKKIETQKVSLENVIIKENEEVIMGTVKVSNLSFKKEVIIRTSFDNWDTHEDIYCNFVSNTSTSSVNVAYVLYDTFSFNIPLPTRVRRMEFCICFRCEGTEYWDNNDNKNYIIVKKLHSTNALKTDNQRKVVYPEMSTQKCFDAVQAKLDTWSEFASWTHLENTAPYW